MNCRNFSDGRKSSGNENSSGIWLRLISGNALSAPILALSDAGAAIVTVLIYFFIFQVGFKSVPPVPGFPMCCG